MAPTPSALVIIILFLYLFTQFAQIVTNSLDSFPSIMLHALVVPACLATISAIQFGLRGVPLMFTNRTAITDPEARISVTRPGGWKLLKLLGCLALLGLSIASLVIHSAEDGAFVARLSMCITFAYATVLGTFSTFGASKLASYHLTLLLLVTFGIYAYRDIFPLAQYDKQPMDLSEGKLLWPTICVLGVTGILVTLLTPRKYIPIDPEHPSPNPSPEQTASPLSLALWSFLDPVIYLANRVSHLTYEQLPPLADSDEAHNLVKRSFPELDPFSQSKKQHIFWGFFRVYRYEYIAQFLLLIVQVFAQMASPIGITGLLKYMERGGEGSAVRPWFWIVWLFLGPTVNSICSQLNSYLGTRTVVQMEAIITQLVFEHALRIRMKADVHESPESTSDNVLASDTPDSSSIAESTVAEPSADAGSAASSVKGKKKAHSEETASVSSATRKDKSKGVSEKTSANLLGRINNLVSTDLGNITEARIWPWLTLYLPLQVALCVVFLYIILGWSCFVGFAVMALCFPMPGYIANQMQSAQMEKMNQSDNRVQAVTETLNVLRMIKLFG
ncbi:hypothetical protein FIBSPDRAFT_801212, partial [Athelia psychrophila]